MTAVILVAEASSGMALVDATVRQGIVALAFLRAAPPRLRASVVCSEEVGVASQTALGVFPCSGESPWTVQRSRSLPGSSVIGANTDWLN